MKFTGTDIDRREWTSLGRDSFQREYMLPLRPVVIAGGFNHWAARGKWTPEFFSQQHGSRAVLIDGQRWRLGDLIDEIQSSTPEKPAPYLRNELLTQWPAELLADVSPMPECTRPNWLESRAIPSRHPLTYVELYIGGAGARFPVLHYDNLHTHAFLMQLYGEKQYLALAPDQASFLYPQDGEAANKSSVDDLENPDLKRFPLFDQAQAVRFTLGPGETLFVPAGWWHTARILSTSITVSVNGANKANWSAFRKDLANEHKAHRWRARLLPLYLVALGVLFSLLDVV
jgi:histone arginine demethylase JMJD6